MVKSLILAAFCATLCVAISPSPVPSPIEDSPSSLRTAPESMPPRYFSFWGYMAELVDSFWSTSGIGIGGGRLRGEGDSKLVKEKPVVWKTVKFTFQMVLKFIEMMLRPITNWFTHYISNWCAATGQGFLALMEQLEEFSKKVEKEQDFYNSLLEAISKDFEAMHKKNEKMFKNRKRPFKYVRKLQFQFSRR